MKKTMYCILSLILIATLSFGFISCKATSAVAEETATEKAVAEETATEQTGVEPAIPSIPEVSVSFGHEPYLDHTHGIIGMEKGWFGDVGITITPEPNGDVVSSENTVGVLAAGTYDVLSGSSVLFLSAYQGIPPFKAFVHGDIFQGYAIMAQPDAGYKTVQDFIDEGMEPTEALGEAAKQMEGKKFAYPPEGAIKGFIILVLEKAGMTLDDVRSIVAEDAKTSALMVAKEADFQVGGVPSRLTLESEGFLPIITSGDLAQHATPSPESVELRAIFHDGWISQDSWIDENYDTMLRMSSVMYRITEFMNTNQEEAISIHLPFLNSAAGTSISPEATVVVYESLDPFITFEDQAGWYLDENNPLHYSNVTGSHIKMYEEQELFEPGEVSVEDVSIAEKVYKEFLDMQEQSNQLMAEAEAIISGSSQDMTQAQELLDQAKFYYDVYNFLDSMRFAEAAVEWANYLNK